MAKWKNVTNAFSEERRYIKKARNQRIKGIVAYSVR